MISDAHAAPSQFPSERVAASAAAHGLDPRETSQVRVLVPTGYGLNCEAETAAAFGLLGARVELHHVSDLLAEPARIHAFDVMAFIGGFSFGDHVASGRVFANRLRFGMGDALARFVAEGKHVVGMCNGFQALVKLGLLPGPLAELGDADDRLAPQRASVIVNERVGYRDGWVRLVRAPSSACVWLRDVDTIECPARHGEGRLIFAEGIEQRLAAAGQVCLRYVDASGQPTQDWPANPNGSPGGAAALCDASGRVFGLMPHPEAFLYPENHPRWLAMRHAAGRSPAGEPASPPLGSPPLASLGRSPAGEPAHGAGLRLFANGLRAALAR